MSAGVLTMTPTRWFTAIAAAAAIAAYSMASIPQASAAD
jgi:hypothetical protein